MPVTTPCLLLYKQSLQPPVCWIKFSVSYRVRCDLCANPLLTLASL